MGWWWLHPILVPYGYEPVIELPPGEVPEEHFELLLGDTSIHSKTVIAALHDHLVMGIPTPEAYVRRGANKGLFHLNLRRLRAKSGVARSLSRFYPSAAESPKAVDTNIVNEL
ncbi:Na(+)-translocating NADH-quinone reductase subunit C [Pseudomonas amygdali pv. lachrymans]|nr:Na(+)-translocating NADH-quinone reductase subunit C [Pseudomonas amygdali pv. lachrymans]